MSITYYQSNRILDLNFGSTSYIVPATLYWGLSTTALNNDGTGVTEPSGGASYARVSFTNNKTNFGNAASGSLTNSVAVTFPESTGSWGTVTHVFVADSGSIGGGNILYFDTLSPSRSVPTGTTVYFVIGAITVQMTNS